MKDVRSTDVMAKRPEDLPFDALYKILLSFYSTKYPHNPDGILNVHIDREAKEGLTEHEAVVFLAKQIPNLHTRIESLPKEFLEPIEEAFPARYVGGHPLHPNSREVGICLRASTLEVPELEIIIPYARITRVKPVTQEEVQVERLLLVGVLAFGWKKERRYLHLSFADQVGLSHDMIFDVEKVEDVVPSIYQRVVAAKEKRE